MSALTEALARWGHDFASEMMGGLMGYTVSGRGSGRYEWEVEYEEVVPPLLKKYRWAAKAVNVSRDGVAVTGTAIGEQHGEDEAEAVEKVNALMTSWAESQS